jgi:hypothetical protein
MSDNTTEKTPRQILIEIPPGSRLEGLFDAVLKAHKQRRADEAAAEEREKAERMKAAAAGETYHGFPHVGRAGRATPDLTEQQIATILFERGTTMTVHALTRLPMHELAVQQHAIGIGVAGEGDWIG